MGCPSLPPGSVPPTNDTPAFDDPPPVPGFSVRSGPREVVIPRGKDTKDCSIKGSLGEKAHYYQCPREEMGTLQADERLAENAIEPRWTLEIYNSGNLPSQRPLIRTYVDPGC